MQVTAGGVFLSSDNGTSWTAVNNGLSNTYVDALVVSGTNIFVGTIDGVFLSSDNGSNWTFENKGLPSWNVGTLAVSDSIIFAGTNGDGVWRRPLSDITTGVQLFPDKPSSAFMLSKNYPNPFNYSTLIKYSLPEKGNVSLTVYNSFGQRVATLVSKTQQAGTYKIRWNAVNFSNGIYFYSLTVNGTKNFTQTKKMILLK